MKCHKIFSQMVLPALIFNVLLALSPVTAEAKNALRIVALGDSLTAGYGLPRNASFPKELEKELKKRGLNVRISNAGISGDTASGGLARLSWAVPKGTDAVILELGANDALRGINPKITKRALEKIVSRLKKRGIKVLIAGMLAPAGMGDAYSKKFSAIFSDLAAKYNTLYYPFFLDGIALDPKFNLADGMHPNKKGVKVIVRNIMPSVLDLIKLARN